MNSLTLSKPSALTGERRRLLRRLRQNLVRRVDVEENHEGICEICCYRTVDATIKFYTLNEILYHSYKLCSECFIEVLSNEEVE